MQTKFLVWKPEGKRPLGRPRRRWENDIRMDLRKIGLEVMDWSHVVQVRDRWWAVVNTGMNPRVQ
jgi:ribosome biogenesis protein Nip4